MATVRIFWGTSVFSVGVRTRGDHVANASAEAGVVGARQLSHRVVVDGDGDERRVVVVGVADDEVAADRPVADDVLC